jgi:hypothetical protein
MFLAINKRAFLVRRSFASSTKFWPTSSSDEEVEENIREMPNMMFLNSMVKSTFLKDNAKVTDIIKS